MTNGNGACILQNTPVGKGHKEHMTLQITFKSNDLGGRVHDGRVPRDGPADGIGGVTHVDDDHLCCVPHLLPDTDELVRLHGEGIEPDVGCLDPDIGELKHVRTV